MTHLFLPPQLSTMQQGLFDMREHHAHLPTVRRIQRLIMESPTAHGIEDLEEVKQISTTEEAIEFALSVPHLPWTRLVIKPHEDDFRSRAFCAL